MGAVGDVGDRSRERTVSGVELSKGRGGLDFRPSRDRTIVPADVAFLGRVTYSAIAGGTGAAGING